MYKPEVFEYYEAYPDKAFIFVIVLCYSSIAPLILLFGLLYFLIMYLTETYRLLYVCESKSHSGGMLWTTGFNQVCFGVGLYHVTMIGIFLLNQYIYGAAIGFIMLLWIIGFTYYMNTRWYPIAYYGSMESLVEEDELVPPDSDVFGYVYCHPSLLPIPLNKQEFFGVAQQSFSPSPENTPEKFPDSVQEDVRKTVDIDFLRTRTNNNDSPRKWRDNARASRDIRLQNLVLHNIEMGGDYSGEEIIVDSDFNPDYQSEICSEFTVVDADKSTDDPFTLLTSKQY